jgi:hypothetical protein
MAVTRRLKRALVAAGAAKPLAATASRKEAESSCAPLEVVDAPAFDDIPEGDHAIVVDLLIESSPSVCLVCGRGNDTHVKCRAALLRHLAGRPFLKSTHEAWQAGWCAVCGARAHVGNQSTCSRCFDLVAVCRTLRVVSVEQTP